MEFKPLVELAITTSGIAFVVGLLIFLVKKVLPPEPKEWLFGRHPWLVNALVVSLSVGVAFLGRWLNFGEFGPRTNVELAWLGLFSAGVSTFGYEFIKNGVHEIVEYMR